MTSDLRFLGEADVVYTSCGRIPAYAHALCATVRQDDFACSVSCRTPHRISSKVVHKIPGVKSQRTSSIVVKVKAMVKAGKVKKCVITTVALPCLLEHQQVRFNLVLRFSRILFKMIGVTIVLLYVFIASFSLGHW
jgi:hypothetical protein